jgi:hypothetical protein
MPDYGKYVVMSSIAMSLELLRNQSVSSWTMAADDPAISISLQSTDYTDDSILNSSCRSHKIASGSFTIIGGAKNSEDRDQYTR